MFDDFELDINLNEVWNEVKQLYALMSRISLEWTDKDNVTHHIPYLYLFFGAWLVFELMSVFFAYNWTSKDMARGDVYDDGYDDD